MPTIRTFEDIDKYYGASLEAEGSKSLVIRNFEDIDKYYSGEPVQPSTGSGLLGLGKSLATGLAEGITTGVPEMIGEAGEFVGAKTGFTALEEAGKALDEWAEGKSEKWFGKKERTGLDRIVYEGSRMLGPSLIPYGAFLKGFKVIKGVGMAVKAAKAAKGTRQAASLWTKANQLAKKASNLSSASVAGLFGASAAQNTVDNAEQAALRFESEGKFKEAEAVRKKAQGLAPYLTGGIEAIGEYLGTKYLAKLFRLDEAEIIRRGATNVVKDFLKTLGVETGTEFGQQFGQATVEKLTGIRPEADPIAEALDVLGPTAFMTLLTGTAAGVARGLGELPSKEPEPTPEDIEARLKEQIKAIDESDLEESAKDQVKSLLPALMEQVSPVTEVKDITEKELGPTVTTPFPGATPIPGQGLLPGEQPKLPPPTPGLLPAPPTDVGPAGPDQFGPPGERPPRPPTFEETRKEMKERLEAEDIAAARAEEIIRQRTSVEDRLRAKLAEKKEKKPEGAEGVVGEEETKEFEEFESESTYIQTIESVPKYHVDLLQKAGQFFKEELGENPDSKTGRWGVNLLTSETAPYATGGKGSAKFGVTNRGEKIHDIWAKTNELDFVEDSADAFNVHNAYHEWLHTKFKDEKTIQKEAIRLTRKFFGAKEQPTPVPEAKGKEAWEMVFAEYSDIAKTEVARAGAMYNPEGARDFHLEAVKAQYAKDPSSIPANVLAEYPELTKEKEPAPDIIPITRKEFEEPGRLIEKRINAKYADILKIESRELTGDIFQSIEDHELSPENLDKHFEKIDNEGEKLDTIADVESVIADQIGDLISTHRAEGHDEGQAFESYLDELLKVTQTHKGGPVIPAGEVSPARPEAEAARPGEKPVPPDRRADLAEKVKPPKDRARLSGLMSGKIPINQENLEKLLNEELDAVSDLMGAPKSGTKQKKIDRILDLWDLRKTLKKYGDDPQVLVDEYSLRELKAFARRAKSFLGGNKRGIAAGLLNWRNQSRRKGQRALREAREAVEEKPAPKVEVEEEEAELTAEQTIALEARKKQTRRAGLAGEAKDFRTWVKYTGGVNIKDPSWKGEFDDIRWGLKHGRKVPARGFPVGFWKKTGRGLDERVRNAIEAGWLPEGSTDQDFLDAITSNPTQRPEDFEADIDKLAEKMENEEEQRIIYEYGSDYAENPRYWDDLARGFTPKAQEDLKGKTTPEVAAEENVPQENIDELNDFFDEVAKEPFKLTPSEPSTEEKIALRKAKGEIVSPEKTTKKAVIPTEKIKAPTTGKQETLLGPQEGETLDLFGKPTTRLAAQPEAPFPGISLRDLNAAIETARKAFRGVRIVSVQNEARVPPKVMKAVRKDRGHLRIKGFYYGEGNIIYLIADNIRSPQEALTVLIHEAVGHAGLRLTLRDRAFMGFLGDLYKAKTSDIEDLATELELNMRTPAGRDEATEEWFARSVSEGWQANGRVPAALKEWWDKFVRIFRDWMRKKGFHVKLSDSEIAAVMYDAQRAVREGEIPRAGEQGLIRSMAEQVKALSEYAKTQNFKKWFKKSVVTEKDKPLPMYHAGSFREEEDGAFVIEEDGGVHFGSEDAARARIGGLAADTAIQEIEVYENEDGTWGFEIEGSDYGGEYASEAEAYDEAEELASQTDPGDEAFDEPLTVAWLSIQNPKRVADQGADWTKAIVQAKKEGYDGIEYVNQFEDKGSISYIAFKGNQIKSADNIGTYGLETDDIRFMFAGPKALTARKTELDKAVQEEVAAKANLTKSGYEEKMEQVRRDTGWRLDLDGKWKFEIDDSEMRIKQDISKKSHGVGDTTLGEFIDHPDLFDAYPELSSMRIRFRVMGKEGGSLRTSPATGKTEIYLNPNLPTHKQSLIHEIQHAVQGIEGFAKGGNLETFAYAKNYFIDGKVVDEFKGGKGVIIRHWQRNPSLEGLEKEFKTTLSEWRQRLKKAKRPSTIAEYREKVSDWEEAIRLLPEAKTWKITETSQAHEKYLRLAGEIEAREAATRRPLTAAERRITPLFRDGIPAEDVIVRFGEGVAAAEPITRLSAAGAKAEAVHSDIAVDSSLPFLKAFGDIWKARKTGWKEGKPDTAWIDRFISVASHHFKKVPALQRMYEAALRRTDQYYEKVNDITAKKNKDGAIEEYYTKRLEDLKKQAPKAYAKLQKYLIHRDRNQIGYTVREEGGVFDPTGLGAYDLINPKGKKVDTFPSEDMAWAAAIHEEVKAAREKGVPDQVADALDGARRMTHNGFNILVAGMRDIIESHKAAGLDLPTVTIEDGKGKLVKVDLEFALKKMGDIRGYYMPRIRKPGRFMLTAKKKGTNPILEFFDWPGKIFPTAMVRRENELKRKGYTVKKDLSQNLPEDVFEMAGKVVAMQAQINQALKKVNSKKLSLDDFNLKPIDRRVRAGHRDFGISGPTPKWMSEVFKALGGKYYSAMGGEPKMWHFINPGSNFESRVAKALASSEAKQIIDQETQVLFAAALTEQVANVIKGRGHRAHMIRRVEAKGTDVWIGYEEDPAIALAKYSRGIAAGEAKKNMALSMVRAFTGTDISWTEFKAERGGKADYEEYLELVEERRVSPTDQPNAFKEGKVYMQDLLRNEEFVDRAIGVIKGAAVLKYLGGRISAPLVNLTALATSVPAAMEGFANIPFTKTPKLLTQAALHYRTYLWGDRSKLPSGFEKLFDRIEEQGWHKAQYNREALAVLQSQVGRGWDRAIDISMMAFGATEQLNRVATITATYQGIKAQKGKDFDHDAALELAKEVSDKAHGVYGKANLLHLGRGTNVAAQIIKSFYVFRTFSHNYLLTMKDLWGPGWTPEHAKAFSYMLLSPAVLAGAGATIATPLIATMAKALGIGGDDPEEEFYKWLEENLGEYYENIGRFGVFGLAGVSLKGSLQIGITDIPTSLTEVLGAPGSMIQDVYRGLKSLAREDYLKGIEKLLPLNAIGSMVKAVREGTRGVTTRTNAPVFYGREPLVPDTVDSIYRFLSFNPARVAGIREKQYKEYRITLKYNDIKRDIYAKFKAFYGRPPRKRKKSGYIDLLREIKEFNERIRIRGLQRIVSPITGKSLRGNLRRAFKPPKREALRNLARLKRAIGQQSEVEKLLQVGAQ